MTARPQYSRLRTASFIYPQWASLKGLTAATIYPQWSKLTGILSGMIINPGLGGVAYPFDTCQLSAFIVTDGLTADSWVCQQVIIGSEPSVTLVGATTQGQRTYIAPATMNGCQLTFRWIAIKAGYPDSSATVSHTIRGHGWSWAGPKAVRGPVVSYAQ